MSTPAAITKKRRVSSKVRAKAKTTPRTTIAVASYVFPPPPSAAQTDDAVPTDQGPEDSASEEPDEIETLLRNWNRLHSMIESKHRPPVADPSTPSAGTTKGRRTYANGILGCAERLGKSLETLVRRLESERAEEARRARMLEQENADLLDRTVLLRRAVPAMLRRSSMKPRSQPLIFSSYKIDTVRHVPRSVSNFVPEAGNMEVKHPIAGRGVEKSRYQKHVKHVVVDVSGSSL